MTELIKTIAALVFFTIIMGALTVLFMPFVPIGS